MLIALWIAVAASTAASPPPSSTDGPLTGRWQIQGSRTVFQFEPCERATCAVMQSSGRIIRDPDVRDVRNPDSRLRDRPLKGLRALTGLTEAGPRTWKGRLYSPGPGLTYDVTVTQVDADTLTAHGCLTPILCQTDTLKRLP